MSVGPTPTTFDRRVLARCGGHAGRSAGVRTHEIVWRFPVDEGDLVLRILRGLGHLGYAKCHGGWWRVTDKGRALLEMDP